MSTGGKPSNQAMNQPDNRPMTFDHLKSMKKPVTRSVRLCMDSELGEELEQAQQNLRFAEIDVERNGDDRQAKERLRDAKRKEDELRKQVAERSVKFVFRSIGRKGYETLLLAYPPTEEQRKRAMDQGEDPDNLGWDPDQFPPALIAEAMVEPEFTLDQVLEIYNSAEWSAAEIGVLFQTAQQVQAQASVVDLGKD